MGAAAAGAVVGAAVASSSSKSQPPPQRETVVVVQQPAPVYQQPPPGASVTVVHTGGGGHGHSGPIRAIKLGKRWRHGNLIELRNLATRKNLRIDKHNNVDGLGGGMKWANFYVERTGVDRVKLRNSGHGNYLRCHPHGLDHGPGGPQCEFWVVKHGKQGGEKVYSLESCSHPGHYVGFHDNGSVKPPHNTGLGAHGSFHIIVKKYA